jgi:hypothetical protein
MAVYPVNTLAKEATEYHAVFNMKENMDRTGTINQKPN